MQDSLNSIKITDAVAYVSRAAYEKEGAKYLPEPIEAVDENIFTHMVQSLSKSFPICRTISYYIEAYTLINRSFEFHFMKTV